MGASRSRRSPEARRGPSGEPAAAGPAGGAIADAVAEALRGIGTAPGVTLCCALSGGVDSVVLLHQLALLQPRFGYRLVAAHIHHGLSPNADAWLAFCRRYCGALGVSFHSAHVEVARDDPAGLEAAARRARYAALERIPCDWLVLGHHQDDQAETVLFRLMRGAGARGAAGMAAVEAGRPGRLRPLLGTRRAALVACAEAADLTWVEDESNADQRYARNALRHRVLPAVESVFPAAVPALARAADNLREASALLDDLAEIDECACGGVRLDRAALLALVDERVRNLLRWQSRRFGAEAPTRVRLQEVVRQLRATSPERALRIALGALACCSYRGRVWLEPAAAAAGVPQPWRGEAALPWGSGRVRLVPAVGEGLAVAALDGAGEVWLRGRWPGLLMQVHPRRPRRTFKNLCQEAGIPVWLRDRLPVLAVDGRPAWIGELGVAAELACGPGEAGLIPLWEPAG